MFEVYFKKKNINIKFCFGKKTFNSIKNNIVKFSLFLKLILIEKILKINKYLVIKVRSERVRNNRVRSH